MYNNRQFDHFARKYRDTVFRVAYGFLKNPADAEDVTQDTLIQLYKTEKDFASEEHLKNWLIRVAVNYCKKQLRSPWHRTESVEEYAETLGFAEPECGGLFSAVMELEIKYRSVILLHYYCGYSAPEIAKLLRVPENTVYTRLSRARARLRDYLTEVCFDD